VEQFPAVRAALDHAITAHFRDTSLLDVLAELSRQAGVLIRADARSVEQRHYWTTESVRTNFRIADMRLESILELIAEAFVVSWRIDQDGILITEKVAPKPGPHAVVYPLPGVLLAGAERRGGRLTEEAAARMLVGMVRPSSWDEASGLGHVRAMPGALIVAQTPEVQRDVADFLEALRRLAEEGTATSEEACTARRWPTIGAIRQALARRVSIRADGEPLLDFLDRLAAEQDVNIVSHDLGRAWGLPGVGSARVSLAANDMRLGDVLAWALDEQNLEAVVRHEAIVLVDSPTTDEQFTWRLLPVPADTLAALSSGSPDDPTRLLTRHVDPASWAIVGGSARVAVVPGGLAVLQTDARHEPVERFLLTLTQALDPTHVGDAPPLTPGEREIEQALDRPVTIERRGQTLRQGLTELFAAAGLTRYRIDDESIEVDGLRLDVADWPLPLRDVPPRSALRVIEQMYDIRAALDDDTLILTSSYSSDDIPLTPRFYRVPLLIGPSGKLDEATLLDLVFMHTEYEHWDEVGGPGTLSAISTCLVVTAEYRVHRKMRTFLDDLTSFVAPPSPHADARSLPSDSVRQRRLHAALAEPATIDADGRPLNEVLAQVAERHDLVGQLLIDSESLESFRVPSDTLVTVHIANTSLAGALTRLLGPLELDWTIQPDVLLVTTAEDVAYHFPETRFYPLPWLTTEHPDVTGEALMEAIIAHVWQAEHIDVVPDGLVVTHARPTHLEIGRFLEQFSRLLTRKDYPVLPDYAASISPDPSSAALVVDVRPFVTPAGPWTTDELIELTAAFPFAMRQNEPTVLGGIFLVAPQDAQARESIEQLLTDRDGCLTRLRRLTRAGETDEGLAACQAALADPSPVVRCQALALLAEMGAGARPAVPEILALLASDEWRVRYAAIESLATAGPAPDLAAAPVAELLWDENDDLRRAAAETLRGFGPGAASALPMLRRLLASDDKPDPSSESWSIIRALGAAALPLLIEQLEPPNPLFLDVCETLEKLGPRAAPAAGQLGDLLRRDLSPFHIQRVCSVLGKIGPGAESVIPVLIEVAQRERGGREAACAALGAIGRQPHIVVPVLEQLLFDQTSAAVRQKACQSLGQFGADAAPALPALRRAAADDSMGFIRDAAAIAIQRIESPPPATPKGKKNQGAAP
jgi:HEAT repeat protein